MTRGAADSKSCDNIRDMSYFKSYDFKETNDETLKNLLLEPPIDYLL